MYIFRVQLLTFIVCLSVHAAEITPITKEHTTYWVLKRFYIIKRLEKTVALLEKNSNKTHFSSIDHLIPTLQHPCIQQAAQKTLTTGNITPLLSIWQHLSTYRSLRDELLVKEFIQVLCTIAYEFTATFRKDYKEDYDDNIDLIAHRFYHIQRLEHAVHCCLLQAPHDPLTLLLQDAWDDMLHYKNIDNEKLPVHVCSLIMALLRPDKKSDENTQKETLETLLNLIDEATDKLDQKSSKNVLQQLGSWFYSLVQPIK